MLYLIWGPPGSGKTTYAKSKMVDGDIIIDFDLIAEALTGMEVHCIEFSLITRVFDAFNYLVDTEAHFPNVRNTFIVKPCPTQEDRQRFEDMGAELVFMDTPQMDCVSRCVHRGEKFEKEDFDRWTSVVKKWFEKRT